MQAKLIKMSDDRRVQLLFVALAGLTAALWGSPGVAAGNHRYPAMAPIGEYLIASQTQEIALARSAAPASISAHAEVLVLGKNGYHVAVQGSNGFVCLVVRSWDNNFDNLGILEPQNALADLLQSGCREDFFARLLDEDQDGCWRGNRRRRSSRRSMRRSTGRSCLRLEPGAMCYMMSKQQYLNDQGKSWRPHVMFYLPDTRDIAWGANLPGTPVIMGQQYVDHISVFMVLVPVWSDGTPAPSFK